jgi:hypothetical protein
MTPNKMAEVTYIDLNEYIIVHRSKWVDPSGESHTVEYRARQYPPPEVDRYEVKYVEKWRDGVHVETLSPSQLITRIQHWTYAPEPVIDVAVWRQLGTREQRNYDVLMQWKQNDGGVIHLVEIIKYHMASTFDLWRDGKCIYRGHKQMLDTEEKHMKNWLIARTLHDINTYKDKLSPELQAWWGRFWAFMSDRTEETFAITQDNYDRVCLALENLRYYYSENGRTCPPSLTVDRCKQALDIFSRSLPRDPGLLPPALQPTPESPDMRSPAAERHVRPTEKEKLRVIGERLGLEINRLNQLRKDVLHLKQDVQRQSTGMPNKNDLLRELGAIYELFPALNNSAYVVFDMENRLSKDIEKKLENVRAFLTYFNIPDYPELHKIETKVTAIRDALRELLKDNKSTVKEYSEARKKTSEESNGQGNPPTGDSAAPEEAKGDNKPGLWDRIRHWRPFGRGENIKSLLLELEALGDDSLYKS